MRNLQLVFKRKLHWFLVGLTFLLTTASVFAEGERISEAEFLGAVLAGEEVGDWISSLESRPKSISIYSTRTKAPLAEDFASVLETEIYKSLSRIDQLRIQSCPDCRVPQAKVMGDRIVITKGTPDIETLKQKGRESQVEAFLVAETYRTGLSLMVIANLYQTSSGEIISSKTFRIPVVRVGDSATMILVNAGLGFKLGGKSSGGKGAAPPIGGSISFLEELGFGKGGLTTGVVVTPNDGSLWYLAPTVGWRGRFGGSAIYSLSTFSLGYGHSGKAGITPRFSYDIMIGSFTNIGVEGLAFIPLQDNNKRSFTGYGGFHIGFVLGR